MSVSGGGGGSGGDVGPSPSGLIARARGQSIGSIIINGFGATLLAIWIAGINVLQELAGVLAIPLNALGIETGNVVTEFFGGIADTFRAAAVTTQQSLLPGQPWAVGPFTLLIAAIAIGATLFVVGQILRQPFTGDTVLGVPIDFPGLGTNEEDEG